MISREIISLQHPIVKHLIFLRKSRSYRQENQSVCLVGNKIITELSSKFPLKTLLVEKNTPLPPNLSASKIFYVSPQILKKISGLTNPETLLAEIALPEEASLDNKKFLLVLDHIADPGNLGTLLRSALALGWDGVFITQNSCDPFNDKALRAAKGATFFLPILQGTWSDFQKIAKKNHITCVLADLKGKPFQTVDFAAPLALVLSNEAHGSSDEVKLSCTQICIPMKKDVESLNVAMAGSILLYHLRGPL